MENIDFEEYIRNNIRNWWKKAVYCSVGESEAHLREERANWTKFSVDDSN